MAKQTKAPQFIRPGIVPGLAGMIAMFIGMGFYANEWYITVLFAISILAAIMTVFSFQAIDYKKFIFGPLFALITVYWNPIFRLNEGHDSGGQVWLLIQVAAAAVFFLGGFMLKTPAPKQ